MRRLLAAAAVLAALLVPAQAALGHAVLQSSTPAAGARLAVSPDRVGLTFNEPVQLLQSQDLEVVDGEGTGVTSGPARVRRDDSRVAEVPLRPGLAEGTYTVRWKVIGADSHVIPGVFVFGVGPGELDEPFLAGSVTTGPSETSPWSVSARFLEIVGLGGLIGLLAFRWLVWRPVWRRPPSMPRGEREALLAWGRDAFWVGFGVLAVGAMLAEGYLLVVHSASALGTSVWDAVRDATGIGQVLGDTRFGSLVQLRGALLFAVFALGAVQFLREYGSAGDPRPAAAAAGRVPSALMAALLLSVIGGIAAQGHASVAPLPALQIGAQLAHIAAVAVWIAGLGLLGITLWRAPRIAPRGGPELAGRVLARFSKVALAAVAIAVATGVVRSVAELSDPAELWETAYGRSIVYKLLLLAPIVTLALYNRRVVTALRRAGRPNRPTLALVRRTAGAELALSLGIVLVASLLVAQVPGAA